MYAYTFAVTFLYEGTPIEWMITEIVNGDSEEDIHAWAAVHLIEEGIVDEYVRGCVEWTIERRADLETEEQIGRQWSVHLGNCAEQGRILG